MHISLDVDQVDSNPHLEYSPNKKIASGKLSNLTNVSTVDTNFICLSRDALTPYGTRSQLSNNNLHNYISDKDISDNIRKDLVGMRDQMERNLDN